VSRRAQLEIDGRAGYDADVDRPPFDYRMLLGLAGGAAPFVFDEADRMWRRREQAHHLRDGARVTAPWRPRRSAATRSKRKRALAREFGAIWSEMSAAEAALIRQKPWPIFGSFFTYIGTWLRAPALLIVTPAYGI
jgi:hypothetical protein